MSVLFAARIAEDLGGTKSTLAGSFDTNYTDQSIYFANGVSGTAKWAAPTGVLHIHFEMRTSAGWNNGGTDGRWFRGWSDDSRTTETIRMELSNGDLALQTFQTGAGITGYTVSLNANTRYTFDFVEYVSGSDMVTEFYVNGALQQTRTNTGGSGNARTRNLQLEHNDITSGGCYYSEFYVTDNNQITIGTRLAWLQGNGAGNYTDGTGSYTDLDEVGASGLSLDAAEKYSYALANLAVSPSAVSGVFANVRGIASTGTTQTDPFVRISATDYAHGNIDINNAPPQIAEWATNPATGVAWTESDVNGLEFGLEGVA